MDILSLSSTGYSSPIKACNISSLTKQFKSTCKNNSLYSLIKNDSSFNIEKLHSSFNKSISGMYKEHKTNKKSLFYNPDFKPTCGLQDSIALAITNSVNGIRLAKHLTNINFLNNSTETLKTKLEKMQEHEDVSILLSSPYYRELLNKNSFSQSELSNLPNSLINSTKSKEELANKLSRKCNETYEKAVASLCIAEKDNSVLSYKKSKKILRAHEDETNVSQSQYISYLCEKKDNRNISEHLDKMNDSLPKSQQRLNHTEIAQKSYHSSFQSVRERICAFIPKQVSSIEDGLEKMGCNSDTYSEDCLYLESYKKIIEQEKEVLAKNSNNNSTDNHASNTNTRRETLLSNSRPPAIISQFIASEEEIETQQVKEQVATTEQIDKKQVNNKPIAKVTTKKNNSDKRIRKSMGKTNTNRSPASISQGSTNYNPVSNTIDYNSYSASAYTEDENRKSQQMNTFYKELAKKIKRAKKNNNNYASDSNASSSLQKAKELLNKSQQNLDKVKNILKDNSSTDQDYDQNGYDLSSNSDIDEMIADEMYSDSNFGTGQGYENTRTPESSEKNASAPSYSKGYAYKNIRGDTVNLQGIEINSIPNRNFEGVIGEEIPEVVLYGELETDLSALDLNKVVTYDRSKGGVKDLLNLIKEGKPFVIRKAGSVDQRILVKRVGNSFELIKKGDDIYNPDFDSFYSSVQDALEKKILAKIQSKNSVVSASGY